MNEECWICMSSDNPQTLVYSPCLCKTCIHLECMLKWYGPKLQILDTIQFPASIVDAYLKCEICLEDQEMSTTFGYFLHLIMQKVSLNSKQTTTHETYLKECERILTKSFLKTLQKW